MNFSSSTITSMNIIGWAANVNQRILDSTSITVGDKGFVEDSGENSAFTERRLVSLFSPDTYNVIMDFDWAEKDENGKSELDRFVEWYKYRHKRGVNPFEFPSISKFTDVLGSTKTSYYKITSGLSMSKSGYSMRVSMTWVEHFSGMIEIPDLEPGVVSISASQESQYEYGRLIMTFSQTLDTLPLLSDYRIWYAPITGSADYETGFTSANLSELNTLAPTTPKQGSITPGHDVLYRFPKLPKGVYLLCVNGNWQTPEMRTIMKVLKDGTSS